MATLLGVREAVRAALDTIDGLNTYAQMPDALSSPAAVVMVRGQAQRTMGGSAGLFQVDVEIGVYVQAAALENAQDALDPYLAPTGASSIYAALAADTTLGGVASGIMMAGGWTAYGTVQVNGVEYVRAFWRLPVYYRG